MRLLPALVVALTAGPALAALPLHPTGRAVVTQAIDDAIRPGFDAYAEATGALKQATERCGSAEGLAALRSAFGEAVADWLGRSS
jgi:predicted lipoprotein